LYSLLNFLCNRHFELRTLLTIATWESSFRELTLFTSSPLPRLEPPLNHSFLSSIHCKQEPTNLPSTLSCFLHHFRCTWSFMSLPSSISRCTWGQRIESIFCVLCKFAHSDYSLWSWFFSIFGVFTLYSCIFCVNFISLLIG